MSYNNRIASELPAILTRILKNIDRFSETYKLKDLKVSVVDAQVDKVEVYKSNGSTCSFSVEVVHSLESGEEYTSYLEVPKSISGMFILKGKPKMVNNYLTDDYKCNLIGDKFCIDWGFSYNLVDRQFNLYFNDNSYYLTYEELAEQFPERLKLDEIQSLKLMFKMNLDEEPKEITQEIVDGFHTQLKDDTGDIINKRILGVDAILINTLNNSGFNILKTMTTHFYAYGTFTMSQFQKAVDNVFYNQNTHLNSMTSHANINPFAVDSSSSQLIMENEKIGNINRTDYNYLMADIIDPIVTPDGGNVNRINHLNYGTSMINGEIHITVYDLNFNKIQILYLKYLTSRVLVYEEVEDYEDKTFVNKSKVKEILKNRVRQKSDKWEYIQAHPDERLSNLVRYIPMATNSDSVRIAMAARMITQAVPLIAPEESRVKSGHESDASVNTDITLGGTVEGEVIEVTPKSVIININDIPTEYRVPQPEVGIYDVTAVYAPRVKVGDKVKPGESIITQFISKSGSKNLGVNTLVELKPYRGYNYEDGIVISESYAKRIAHYSIMDLDLDVPMTSELVSIIDKGQVVKSGDTLIGVKSLPNDRSLTTASSVLFKDKSFITKSDPLRVPNSIQEAYVVDVKWNTWEPTLTPTDELVLMDWKSRNAKESDIPGIDKSYQVELSSAPEIEKGSVNLRVRLLVKNYGKKFTKLANLYGSKGMVSLVLPDSKMDRTKDGRVIDMILNPDSIFARKNESQMLVMQLVIVANKIREMISTMKLPEAREVLIKHKLKHYAKMDDTTLQEFINSGQPLTYITGTYGSIKPSEILKWFDELKISEYTNVIDGETGRPVKEPIAVSEMYLIKLYHLPENSNKVRSIDSDDKVDPVMGKGFVRKGDGNSLGSMEHDALLASDLGELYTSLRGQHQFKDAGAYNLALLQAGLLIEVKDSE